MILVWIKTAPDERCLANYFRENFGFLDVSDKKSHDLYLPYSFIPKPEKKLLKMLKDVATNFATDKRAVKLKLINIDSGLGEFCPDKPTQAFKNLIDWMLRTLA